MAANDLKDLIRNSGIEGIDPKLVFALRVPSPYNEKVQDKIVILCTDVLTEYDDFGSNIPTSRINTVQIQFFYPEMYADDPAQIENKVLMYAFKHDWCPGYSIGAVQDPETHNLYSTYQINKTTTL